MLDASNFVTGHAGFQAQCVLKKIEWKQRACQHRDCRPSRDGSVKSYQTRPFEYAKCTGQCKADKGKIKDQDKICRYAKNHCHLSFYCFMECSSLAAADTI